MKAVDNLAFKELKELIQKRQDYEKEQSSLSKNNIETSSKNIPRPIPTSWDFKDIHGNTLLFYAAQSGDKEEVENLLAKNPPIFVSQKIGDQENKTEEEHFISQENQIENTFSTPLRIARPLIEALNQGHFEIAELLYEHLQGYESDELKIISLNSVEAKNWLKEKIKNDIKQCGISIKNDFSLPENHSKIFSSIDGLDYNPSILQRFADVGRNDYFNWLVKKNVSIESDDYLYLLKCAIEDGNLNAITQIDHAIKKQNLTFENTEEQNQKTENDFEIDTPLIFRKALNFALKKGNFKAADYLLNQGVDLEGPCDKAGNTIFGKAILSKNGAAIRYLIPKLSNVAQKNYWQQNPLHLAALSKSEEIIKILNQINLPEELKTQEDIFGFAPVDYSSTEINQPEIDQKLINKKFAYYCSLKYLEASEMVENGLCNGYSRLFQLYSPEYFYKTLELIANWDGRGDTLAKHFPSDLPQSQYYRNLDELYRGWINDLVAFAGYKLKNFAGVTVHQDDRVREQEVLTNDKNLIPQSLYETEQRNFLRHREKNENYTDKQIREILSYYFNLPSQARLELKGYAHATGARKEGNQILYYDSNLPKRVKPIQSLDELVTLILDTKYKSVSQVLDDIYDPKKIMIEFLMYVHEKDKEEFLKNSSYRLINKNSLPKDRKDAKVFQKASPNHFTPLHVAIIGRDLEMFKKLIQDGYCNINAKDSSERDVFTLAVENNFKEAIDILMQHKDISYDCFNESDGLLKIYQDDNEPLFRNLLHHPKVVLSADLLTEALFREDNELIDYLLKDKKFNFSSEKINLQLQIALNATTINESALEALLLQGASLIDSNCEEENKQVCAFYYELDPSQTALQKISSSDEISQAFINVLKNIFNAESKEGNNKKVNLDFSILNFFAQNPESYQLFSEKELLDILTTMMVKQTENDRNSTELEELFKNLTLHSLTFRYEELFKYLQENIQYKKESQQDILFNALELKKYDQIKILLDHGYDINMPLKPESLMSNPFVFFQNIPANSYPIIYALQNNFPEEMVQLFLKHGANLDVKNEEVRQLKNF